MEYLDSNFKDHVKELCELLQEYNSYSEDEAIDLAMIKSQEILENYYNEIELDS